MSRQRNELYEFGEYRLDVGERRLERIDGSVPAALPEKAFQTLLHLVRNPGTLITKDELMSAVWPEAIVEENNLGKAIHVVRQSLKEQKGSQKYIETVPKHGYRFVAEVLRKEPESPDGVPPNGLAKPDAHGVVDGGVSEERSGRAPSIGRPEIERETSTSNEEPFSRLRLAVLTLVAIVLAGGAWMGWQFVDSRPGASDGCEPRHGRTATSSR